MAMVEGITEGLFADTIGAAGGEMKCFRFWSLVLDSLPSIPQEKRWIIIAIGMIITVILDFALDIHGVPVYMTGSVLWASL